MTWKCKSCKKKKRQNCAKERRNHNYLGLKMLFSSRICPVRVLSWSVWFLSLLSSFLPSTLFLFFLLPSLPLFCPNSFVFLPLITSSPCFFPSFLHVLPINLSILLSDLSLLLHPLLPSIFLPSSFLFNPFLPTYPPFIIWFFPFQYFLLIFVFLTSFLSLSLPSTLSSLPSFYPYLSFFLLSLSSFVSALLFWSFILPSFLLLLHLLSSFPPVCPTPLFLPSPLNSFFTSFSILLSSFFP